MCQKYFYFFGIEGDFFKVYSFENLMIVRSNIYRWYAVAQFLHCPLYYGTYSKYNSIFHLPHEGSTKNWLERKINKIINIFFVLYYILKRVKETFLRITTFMGCNF